METEVASAAPLVPVLGVVSALDAEAAKRAEADAKVQQLAAGAPSNNLLTFVKRCRDEAVLAKETSGVTERLLDAQRRRAGEHSAKKKAQLAQYRQPDYWVPLTQTKCIHTEAWFRDLLMPYKDNIWFLEPTVLPELPEADKEALRASIAQATLAAEDQTGAEFPQEAVHEVHDEVMTEEERLVVDEAKERAKALEKVILDQQEECGFREVFREFQSNLVTYGTAFLKGPYTIQKKMPHWNEQGQRVVDTKTIPTCSAPSPHDMFPAPWAKNEQEGYMLERIKTYREGLNEVKRCEYYQTKEIEALLKERVPVTTQQRYGDDTRAKHEQKPSVPNDDRIETWQYTGSVPGYMLTEWGITGCEPSDDYRMEVLFEDQHILKVMPRWDDTGVGPYFGARFKTVVGSFWGVGVPHLMSASQDRANMLMIVMLDNASWSSGGLIWAELSRFVNGVADLQTIYPKKVFAIQSQPGQTGAPMGVIEIPLKVPELDALYKGCLTDADNESGVPAYMYGSGQSGPAAGTLGGLNTLMNASARGIKDGLLEVGNMLSRLMQHWADWVLTYEDNPDLKGDVRVVCTAGVGLFVQELQLSNLDNLLNQAVSLAPILGSRGSAFIVGLLRDKAKILKVDTGKLPTDEELEQTAAGMLQPQSSAESPGAPSPQLLPGNTQPGARPEAPPPMPPPGNTP